jgi:radical SAM superfamily enzyme YgiQ (UPF0313 family)
MPNIVLTTLNARYSHASFGLRYLRANLGDLQPQTALLEFTINDSLQDVLAAILEQRPRIVGFGVYIWNVEQTTRLISDLKQVAPQVLVIVGGPEVSYETEQQSLTSLVDYVITGEADLEFPRLCRSLLEETTPLTKILHSAVPQLDQVQLPYDLYSDEDLAHRVLYVEASRGCPFTCEFCLSALEIPVRAFEVNLFLEEMRTLLDRGARQFKFVDRTFNLNLRISRAILEFFLTRLTPDLFLHFEMIPDRLPESLRDIIRRFPAGCLQFEIGIQTLNDSVSQLISRPQDNAKVEENLRFLRNETGVHIHTDLIVGLPGETVDSLAEGFDRLYALRPHEIQVGILKRLRGTPIIRHDAEWQMVYSRHAPYEILSNRLISFEEMNRLKRLAKFWDLIGNSGNFQASLPRMLSGGTSAFQEFLRLSDWMFHEEGKRHGIALGRLFEYLFRFMTTRQGQDSQAIAELLWHDYTRAGRRDRPDFLRPFDLPSVATRVNTSPALPPRQRRHLDEM